VTHTPSRAVPLIRNLLQVGPLLMLAACGGNGSSSSTSTTNTTSTTAPGTPTLDSATAGVAQAVLAFTASTSGGTATSYSGSCAATGATTRSATGTSSPITVTSLTNGTTYTCTVTASNSAGSATSTSKTVTPAAASSGGGTSTTVDTTALPVGTSKIIETVPTTVGYLYKCTNTTNPNNPGNTAQGWFSSDGTTWNLQTKSIYAVTGNDSWVSTFTNTVANALRKLDGNGLPSHTTGIYGITNATNPLAFQYDHNPNKILTNTVAWSGLSTNPTVNATPTCLGGGAVGIFLTGARMFAAFDAKGRDARAWEVTDACEGHPEGTGKYHYHSLPKCGLTADVASQHSAVIGYAADGFAIYGVQGDAGKTITNDDLDICHGHTDTSVTQYHYHTTETFPYTIGCYRGTPITGHD
jgi:hypothetical protein